LRILISVFFIILCFLHISCERNDPVSIVHLEEASVREFGQFDLALENYISFDNKYGGIILDGTGDSSLVDFMLYKAVKAEKKSIAETHLEKIVYTKSIIEDTVNFIINAPGDGETLKYICGLTATVHYLTPCIITNALSTIDVNDLNADLLIRDAGGSINVLRHVGNSIVTTSLGDIKLITALSGSNKCIANTSIGNIKLFIPRDTSARIYAQAKNGIVAYSNLIFTEINEDSNIIDGKLGSGTGKIHLTTDIGNIEITGF